MIAKLVPADNPGAPAPVEDMRSADCDLSRDQGGELGDIVATRENRVPNVMGLAVSVTRLECGIVGGAVYVGIVDVKGTSCCRFDTPIRASKWWRD